MRAGKVAGVQLILNNWFLGLVVLFAVAGLLSKLLLVFGAIFCHEVSHAAAAATLGLKVREIELLPFGGVARIDGLNETEPGKELVIAAAGPVCSALLALLSWLVVTNFPESAAYGWQFFLQVNLMLVCFNLLPALPLDGGRIARSLLCQVWDYNKSTATVALCGKVSAIALLCGAAIIFVSEGTVNVTFIIASLFLYTSARSEMVTAGFRIMQTLSRKKELLMARGVLPTMHFTASANLTIKDVVKLFQSEHYHIVLVVDESLCVLGTITETQLWDALTTRGLYTKMIAIVK